MIYLYTYISIRKKIIQIGSSDNKKLFEGLSDNVYDSGKLSYFSYYYSNYKQTMKNRFVR